MNRDFFDAFPNLNVGDNMREWLEMTTVTKVTSNRERTKLCVHIICSRWIHKKYIYELEKLIKDQLFSGVNIEIKVIKKFRLSKQYTPENFMEVYRSSMLLELKNYHLIEYNLFRTASQHFTDDHILVLEAEDSIVNHSRSSELKRVLEKIFNERLGIPLEVRINLGEHRRHERGA